MGKESDSPQYNATVVKLGRGRRRSLTERKPQPAKEVSVAQNQLAQEPAPSAAPAAPLQGTGAYPEADTRAHATVEELNIGTSSLLDAALLQSNRSFDDIPEEIEEEALTPNSIEKKGVFKKKAALVKKSVATASKEEGVAAQPEPIFKRRAGKSLEEDLLVAQNKRKGQQKALLIAGSFLCLMSFSQFLFGGTGDEIAGVHASSLIGSRPGGAKMANPEISWVEYYLCRGRAKSPFCSKNVKHPFVDKWEEVGSRMNREDRAHTVKSLRQTFYTPDRGPRRH